MHMLASSWESRGENLDDDDDHHISIFYNQKELVLHARNLLCRQQLVVSKMAIYTSSIITPHSPSPASPASSSSSSSCLLRACRFRTFSSGTSPFHSLNKWTQTPSSSYSSSSSSLTSRLQQRHGGSCCSSIGPRSSSSSSSPWVMRMTTPSLQFSLWKETIGVPTSRRRNIRRSRGGGGLVTTAALATPLITATNIWGTWTVLLASAAFGLWYVWCNPMGNPTPLCHSELNCIFRFPDLVFPRMLILINVTQGWFFFFGLGLKCIFV